MTNIETQKRIAIEKRIVRKTVKTLIDDGFVISVFDGEDFAIKRSAKFADVMKNLFTTDQETLVVRKSCGEFVGRVFLVYGNDGYDVIADYTLAMEELIKPALDLADEIEYQQA